MGWIILVFKIAEFGIFPPCVGLKCRRSILENQPKRGRGGGRREGEKWTKMDKVLKIVLFG